MCSDFNVPPFPDLSLGSKKEKQETLDSAVPLDQDPLISEFPQANKVGEYSDEDLKKVLAKLLNHTPPPSEPPRDIEPMLRNVVRRVLAERSFQYTPFSAPSGLTSLLWKAKALFTNRNYEDIIFEKTQRFRVQEAYLLYPHTHALISHASRIPKRNSSPSKVISTVHHIAQKISKYRFQHEPLWIHFTKKEHLKVFFHPSFVFVSIVEGKDNTLLHQDLHDVLLSIEEALKNLSFDSPPHSILQPILESALLIGSLQPMI